MTNSALYNGQNLDFTGNHNPYGLIQNAGKGRRTRTRTKGKRKRTKRKRTRRNRR